MKSLPTGRAGQAAALALTLLVLSGLWLMIVQPMLDWYDDGAATLAARAALVQRMTDLVARLPSMEAQLAQTTLSPRTGTGGAAVPTDDTLLAGASDAIAGAELQQDVQDMARRSGVTVTSTEMLPTTATAGYRRIGLRISATSAWPPLIATLRAMDQASPRMLIDDLRVRGPGIVSAEELSLQVSFTVIAFRADAATRPDVTRPSQ